MKVPLSDEQTAVISSMPKTPYGHVIDPRYAVWPWAEDYIRRLGEWGRRTPRKDWPDWFASYVAERKRESEKPSRRSAFIGVDHSPAGDVSEFEG